PRRRDRRQTWWATTVRVVCRELTAPGGRASSPGQRPVTGSTVHFLSRPQDRASSVELVLLGGTLQRGGRAVRVHRGRDPVEVAGADLTLVLGGGVTPLLGGELALLQVDVGGHLVAGVAVGQIEHRVVQRVEAGQRDELELVAHRAELLLEAGDGRVVQVLAPVERRR